MDVIDLTANGSTGGGSGSEDEDLRRAIALSLRETRDSSIDSPNATTSPRPSRISPGLSSAPSSSSGLLGLDRKQMELDRQMRLKRKRGEDISPPPIVRRAPPSSPNTAKAAPSSNLSNANPLKFVTARVLKTWCFGFPRAHPPDDIKLEELLNRTQLQSCVLSSFIWDFDWLLQKFDTSRTKFLLVMQAKTAEQRTQVENDWNGIPNVRLCFPSMDGQIHCMHSKLMLLFFENFLRVIVPTANLVPFDWGEDGVMENSVFVADLPKKPSTRDGAPENETAFYEDLQVFVKAQRFPEDVLRKLDEFDWAGTARFQFVHSIGGAHTGQAWRRTGLCGLGRAVATLGLQNTQKIQLDFVTSSVGSLNDEFLRSIYLAAQGDDGLAEFTLRTAKKLPATIDQSRTVDETTGQGFKTFRFYFPSDTTVRSSRGGPHKAGTICFSKKWWDSPRFPRASMRDCISERDGLLMHNKILYVRFSCGMHKDSHRYLGWAYVGSANLSESAWGRLVMDKTSKSPKLNCRNWECGVIVPLLAPEATPISSVDGSGPGLDVFKSVVPVPMHITQESYAGKQPWFFMD